MNGEFINLYNNKALYSNGNIYNISTGETINNENIEIKLLDTVVPISEGQYNNTTIQTFAHCSKVIKDGENYTYKNNQMFIKNNNIYVIDAEAGNKPGAIIINSYNNNQYETILGTDGKIYDLLTPIKYPEDFKNEKIVAMTNNINQEDSVVLVYYSSGNVRGFNYITGEEVYNNNVKEKIGLLEYTINQLRTENIENNINKTTLEEAQNLARQLAQTSTEEKKPTEATSTEATYVTAYDTETKSYVVYSTEELLKTDTTETITENEKIIKSGNLEAHYASASSTTKEKKDIGKTIISLIIGTVCLVLIALYRKNK